MVKRFEVEVKSSAQSVGEIIEALDGSICKCCDDGRMIRQEGLPLTWICSGCKFKLEYFKSG